MVLMNMNATFRCVNDRLSYVLCGAKTVNKSSKTNHNFRQSFIA